MNGAEDSVLLGSLTLVTNILLTTGYYHSHHLYLSCSVDQRRSSLSLYIFYPNLLYILHNFGTFFPVLTYFCIAVLLLHLVLVD